MSRQLTEPGHARGRGILRVLEQLGETLTGFAQRRGITFGAWHRMVHAEGDPNSETVLVAKAVRGGIPLELTAPTLAAALIESGWRAPKAGRVTKDSAA
jgi:hypothetical protein